MSDGLDVVLESPFGELPSVLDTNVKRLISVAMLGAQDLEAALQQLLTQRDINSAAGAQLDVIGKIVGQPRSGVADELYRRYVRARVAAHRSIGTFEDLIKVVSLVVFDPTSSISIHNEGTATVRIQVNGIALPDDVADIVTEFVRDAAAAGVRVVVEYSTFADDLRFRLDTPGRGLDAGLLTTAVDA